MSDSTVGWWDRMPAYEEGVTHRNMTNGELFKEKAAKTALVVLALLVAIGMAVAIYYCCTTTEKFLGGWEGYGGWETSNEVLSIIPVVLGIPIVVLLLIASCAVNFERSAGEDTDGERPQLPVNERQNGS